MLRYHGGKWLLARWIIENMPSHRVYVEPFGGAASVLMRKTPVYSEVYNDLDGEIVNVFWVLREHGAAEALRRSLELTPFSRVEFEESYEIGGGDPVERARRTIVRSFMGFGSNSIQATRGRTSFRANSLRSGTTAAHDWASYPQEIPAFVARLRGVCIEQRDAIGVIRQQDSPETLFYVDPPYVHSTRSRVNLYNKKHFYRHELSDEAHAELSAVLHSVVGMVMLSGYPSPLYDSLYSDWIRRERSARADGGRPRREVLWLNPACFNRSRQASLVAAG